MPSVERRLQLRNGKPGPMSEAMTGLERDLVDGGALAGVLDGLLEGLRGSFKAHGARIAALEARPGGGAAKEIGVVVPDADRLAERLTAIEARLTALEARPKGLQYLGIWKEGSTYEQGDVITRQGGMWVAKVNHCQSVPGADGGVGWQLAVKSGRDGRDLR